MTTVIGSAAIVNAAPVPEGEETLKIASLSDTHYLSPDMIKDTADFTEHLNSDRKMFAESDAFLTALLDTIKKDDPDVLLISGDLTKDGEKEGHEALAEKLEALEDETGVQVYITPGNHDLNNSNAMNFNTEDGVAVPAGRTTQEDYREIYSELVYNDDTVTAVFQPEEGKQGGGLSYTARPKDGFTIISIDSARYSADNTESGTDEHETSGNVGPELEAWVLSQIREAKDRGDTVIGLQHHGMVPHFSMEPELLPMYLVNDYERLADEYADAGMSYIFTGHMHANDIAEVTTEEGNTLYDIETGSVVTYPSPARSVTLTRTAENGTVTENMDVSTYTHVGPVIYTDPVSGQEKTIEDITEYGRRHGFSDTMLTTTVNGFLHGYYQEAAAEGGIRPVLEELLNTLLAGSLPISDITLEKLIDVALPLFLPAAPEEGSEIGIYYENGAIKVWALGEGAPGEDENGVWISISGQALKEALVPIIDTVNAQLEDPALLDSIVEQMVSDLTNVPVTEDKNLLDYANYIYQSHLGGEDSQEKPEWVQEATSKVESGELLDTVLELAVTDLTDAVLQLLDQMPMSQLFGVEKWDIANKTWVPLEGRTPLLMFENENSKNLFNTLGMAMYSYGWGFDGANFTFPDEFTVKDLLDNLNVVAGTFGFTIDLNSLIHDLLLGTPSEEGLISTELKGQINGWLMNIVTSMGTDDNYPEDNETTITNQWKLPADRTALDELIAQVQAMDLSGYTAESAQAVKDALDAALALPADASQDEIDAAAEALETAVAALEEQETQTPGGDDTQKPGGDGTQKPDSQKPSGNSGSRPGAPQTGDNSAGILTVAAMLILVSGAVAAITRRKTAGH